MNERVVEILVLIMNQIRGKRSNLNQLEVLSQDLLNRGYSQNEISSAFSWLFGRIKNDFEELVKHPGDYSPFSFRVLHDLEQMIISTDAFGFLLQMKQLGLLDDHDVEQVIERAMMVGTTQISIGEIKVIVASILSQQTDMFDGSFFLDDQTPTIH